MNTNADTQTSVKVGNVEMVLTEKAMQNLCHIKEYSAIYSKAIDQLTRKIIRLGTSSDEADKSHYIYDLQDLQDIKEHYQMIAEIQIFRDGVELLPE